MTINLADWVGKRCTITLSCRRKHTGTVKFDKDDSLYFFECDSGWKFIGYYQYGSNGFYAFSREYQIVHIEEIKMNTQQISEEISKVQAQLESLQVKLKQAEAQEKFNSEFFTPIEENSEYLYCLKFLKTKDVDCITGGFDWANTPQGYAYWNDITVKNKSLDKSDIQQIKDWVINYMIRKENI